MTIVQLSDGLGNQMFQYALGRALALRRGDELVLTTDLLSRAPGGRAYGLDAFTLDARVATNRDYFESMDALWSVREVDSAFNPDVLCARQPHLMLAGYWQTEKYFEDVSGRIREDFTFKDALPDGYADIAAHMAATESVSLHMRLTDYLLPTDTKGFVGRNYYRAAIDVITATVREPHLFVFSDDIEWCSRNVSFDLPHSFVSRPQTCEDTTTADLHLMSLCKHFIIANSTYSWWGAWLGSHAQKQVVAPRRWFRCDPQSLWDPNVHMRLRSTDIIPERWHRV